LLKRRGLQRQGLQKDLFLFARDDLAVIAVTKQSPGRAGRLKKRQNSS